MLDEIRDVEKTSASALASAPVAQRRLSRRMTIAAMMVGALVLGAGGVFGYRVYAHNQDVRAVSTANAAFAAESTSLEDIVEKANGLVAAADTAIASNPTTPTGEILSVSTDVTLHLVEIESILAETATVDVEKFTGDLADAAQSLTKATTALATAEKDLQAALPALETALTIWEAAEIEQAKAMFIAETATLTASLVDAQSLLAGSEGLVSDNETRVRLIVAIGAGDAAVAIIPEGTVASYKTQSAASQAATQVLVTAIQGVEASQEAYSAQKAAEAQAAAVRAAAHKTSSTKSSNSAGTSTGTAKSSASTGSSSSSTSNAPSTTPSGPKYIISDDGKKYLIPEGSCDYSDCEYVGPSS